MALYLVEEEGGIYSLILGSFFALDENFQEK
jgi:hypothetical protein